MSLINTNEGLSVQFGVKPGRVDVICFMTVGAHLLDMDAAEELGCPAVLVTNGPDAVVKKVLSRIEHCAVNVTVLHVTDEHIASIYRNGPQWPADWATETHRRIAASRAVMMELIRLCRCHGATIDEDIRWRVAQLTAAAGCLGRDARVAGSRVEGEYDLSTAGVLASRGTNPECGPGADERNGVLRIKVDNLGLSTSGGASVIDGNTALLAYPPIYNEDRLATTSLADAKQVALAGYAVQERRLPPWDLDAVSSQVAGDLLLDAVRSWHLLDNGGIPTVDHCDAVIGAMAAHLSAEAARMLDLCDRFSQMDRFSRVLALGANRAEAISGAELRRGISAWFDYREATEERLALLPHLEFAEALKRLPATILYQSHPRRSRRVIAAGSGSPGRRPAQ